MSTIDWFSDLRCRFLGHDFVYRVTFGFGHKYDACERCGHMQDPQIESLE